jgi:hypothetical protein
MKLTFKVDDSIKLIFCYLNDNEICDYELDMYTHNTVINWYGKGGERLKILDKFVFKNVFSAIVIFKNVVLEHIKK